MTYYSNTNNNKKGNLAYILVCVCVCSRTIGARTFLIEYPGERKEGEDQQRENDDQRLQLGQRKHRLCGGQCQCLIHHGASPHRGDCRPPAGHSYHVTLTGSLLLDHLDAI